MEKKLRLRLPYQKQKNGHYCGPAALKMALLHLGFRMSQDEIAREMSVSEETGTENDDMIAFARKQGFETVSKTGSSLNDLRELIRKGLPVIVNYIEPTDEDGHYAAVSGLTAHNVVLHDPWNGKNFKLPHAKFLERWHDSSGRYPRWLLAIDGKK